MELYLFELEAYNHKKGFFEIFPMSILLKVTIVISSLILTNNGFSKPTSPNKTFKNTVYETRDNISQKLLNLTSWIDSFFGDMKSIEADNRSRFRVYNISNKFESRDYNNETAFKINFKLPNLQKRLQLHLENRGELETSSTPTPEQRLSTETNRTEENVRAGVSYFFKQRLNLKFKFTTGLRLSSPLSLYSRINAHNNFKVSEKWRARFFSNSFWDDREGFGQSLSFDFERSISTPLTLRFINESTWLDLDDTIKSSHGPSLIHILSPRRVITYNFRINYTNRPHYRMSSYIPSVSYRQNIMKKWFFYELTPQLEFLRADQFSSRFGGTFKVELVFSK